MAVIRLNTSLDSFVINFTLEDHYNTTTALKSYWQKLYFWIFRSWRRRTSSWSSVGPYSTACRTSGHATAPGSTRSYFPTSCQSFRYLGLKTGQRRFLLSKGLVSILFAREHANLFGIPMMSLSLLDIYEW